MVKRYFEDCHLGEKVITPGRTITETDIVTFAAFTGDWMPLHTDVEYAKRTVFGERIAHGVLVLTVGSALLCREGASTIWPESTIALHSINRVRFRAPTRIGDTVHTECEVIQMAELDGARGLVTIKGSITNQRGEIAVAFTMKILVARRPGG